MIKACTIGKRHKWAFVKNVIMSTNGIRHATISERGIYRCECGVRKYGQPIHSSQQEPRP